MALTLAAAFDQADVDRRFRRRNPGASRRNRATARQSAWTRIADAEIAPAMAAGTGEGDLEAAAAERAGGDVVGVGAVDDQEARDLLGQRRLVAQVPHAAAGCLRPLRPHWRPAAGRAGTPAGSARIFQARAMASRAARPGAVVGDAGTAEAPVGIHGDIVFVARREHGIEVRGQRRRTGRRRPSVARTLPARSMEASQPRRGTAPEPRRPLLFQKGGRRHAAELQVDLVDPLLLAGEQLQALAHTAQTGHFPDTIVDAAIDREQCSRAGAGSFIQSAVAHEVLTNIPRVVNIPVGFRGARNA